MKHTAGAMWEAWVQSSVPSTLRSIKNIGANMVPSVVGVIFVSAQLAIWLSSSSNCIVSFFTGEGRSSINNCKADNFFWVYRLISSCVIACLPRSDGVNEKWLHSIKINVLKCISIYFAPEVSCEINYIPKWESEHTGYQKDDAYLQLQWIE